MVNIPTISPRQGQILRAVWRGLTNAEIGLTLGISKRTVEVHRAILMQKMGVHNVGQLIHRALELKLISMRTK